MSDEGLGLLHGAELLAVALAFGRFYFAWRLAPDAPPRGLRLAFVAAAAAALVWVVACSSAMVESVQPAEVLRAVLVSTFGKTGLARAGLLAVLAWQGPRLLRNTLGGWLGLLTMVVTLGLATWTSHAAQSDGALGPVRVAAELAHAGAASLWVGGLWALLGFLGSAATNEERTRRVVLTYSRYATVSVSIILLAGLILAYGAGVRVTNIWLDTYSRLVAGKILLFSVALAAASMNHFVYRRRLLSGPTALVVPRLRRAAAFELTVVAVIYAAAGILTRTMPPA